MVLQVAISEADLTGKLSNIHATATVLLASLTPAMIDQLVATLRPKAFISTVRAEDAIASWLEVVCEDGKSKSRSPKGAESNYPKPLLRQFKDQEVSNEYHHDGDLPLGDWQLVEIALGSFEFSGTLRHMLYHVYRKRKSLSSFTLFKKGKMPPTFYEIGAEQDYQAANVPVDKERLNAFLVITGEPLQEHFPGRLRAMGLTEEELLSWQMQKLLTAISSEIVRNDAVSARAAAHAIASDPKRLLRVERARKGAAGRWKPAQA